MKIRPAEPRDLPALIGMMHELLAFLKGKGQELYTENKADFDNGVVEFLTIQMSPVTEGQRPHTVLVGVDDKDWPVGFICGWLTYYPRFWKYPTVAELQFMWPLAPSSYRLAAAFEAWGKENGATGTSNYATPGNELSVKAILRNGRKKAFEMFFKPLV